MSPFVILPRSVQVAVPDVIGEQRTDAESQIQAAGLVVGAVGSTPDAAPVDEVINQAPLGGVLVDPGTMVNLTVSLGPGGGGDFDHFDNEVARLSGSLYGSRAMRSVADVVASFEASYADGATVGGTPNKPETNSNCRWNSGDRDCAPIWQTDASDQDTLGLSNRSWDALGGAGFVDDRNRLYSAAFDTAVNGARVGLFNDQDSGLSFIVPGWLISPQSDVEVWYQWEQMIDSARFFDPITSTNTIKLMRLIRDQSGSPNGDPRFTDVRSTITSTFYQVEPGFMYSLSGEGGSGLFYQIQKSTHANKWMRFTVGHRGNGSESASELIFRVWDVEAQSLVYDQTTTGAAAGVGFIFYDGAAVDNRVTGQTFRSQSTGHVRDPAEPDFVWEWYRGLIASSAEIQVNNV